MSLRDGRAGELYRCYAPVIYARCRRILGDPRAAEDATQETFVRVVRHLAKAPDAEHALFWIYRIATNYCLNELRARARRPLPIEDAGATTAAAPAPDLVDRDLVVRLLRRLTAQTAQIAWLHHVDGLAREEVARALGISLRTVGNRLAELRVHARRFAEEPTTRSFVR
ncbi:MAG TPA: sigma-70 family RNA polymerase sigma factor [Kofleriaceae bacterium]